jgi:hypothetical protein
MAEEAKANLDLSVGVERWGDERTMTRLMLLQEDETFLLEEDDGGEEKVVVLLALTRTKRLKLKLW